jgi:hypothetical protein
MMVAFFPEIFFNRLVEIHKLAAFCLALIGSSQQGQCCHSTIYLRNNFLLREYCRRKRRVIFCLFCVSYPTLNTNGRGDVAGVHHPSVDVTLAEKQRHHISHLVCPMLCQSPIYRLPKPTRNSPRNTPLFSGTIDPERKIEILNTKGEEVGSGHFV